MNMTIEEKLKIIESSASMAELPSEALPTSHRDDYYFVSYSHLDYKLVLKDILLLEQCGINIWYDSEMHIGENWQEIAELYISKFQCRGIIFYLSENSIRSKACNNEVEYVLEHNKPFFSINIPLAGSHTVSGFSMLNSLIKRGFKCSDELLQNFGKAFSDKVLYLPYSADIQKKAEEIRAIKFEDLLKVSATPDGAIVENCRDNSILSVNLAKKYSTDNGDEVKIKEIGDCVFTNCYKLRTVVLADETTTIGSNAFRNCHELKSINLEGVTQIGSYAFADCEKLQISDFPECSTEEYGMYMDGKMYMVHDAMPELSVGAYAFYRCASIGDIAISGKVGSHAFAETGIKKLTVSGSPKFEDAALCGMNELKEVAFKDLFENDLSARGIFEGDKALEKAGPFLTNSQEKSKRFIVGENCFSGCEQLKELTFDGGWDFSQAKGAFDGCSSLQTLEVEGAQAVIPENFASHCANLKGLSCDKTVENIGDEAFLECSSLEQFDFSSAKFVGERAFSKSGLKKVELMNAEEIDFEAFESCRDLWSVSLGPKVKKIGNNAFEGCYAFTVLKLLSESEEFRKSSAEHLPRNIKVVYLNEVCAKWFLEDIKEFEYLRVVYLPCNFALESFPLVDFEEQTSDEVGYRKFVYTLDSFDYTAETPDIQSEIFNLPVVNGVRQRKSISIQKFFFAHEVSLKHIRSREMQIYFVEQAFTGEDQFVIDKLVVSVHKGKSFVLDGTLVEDFLVWDYNLVGGIWSSAKHDKDEVTEVYQKESFAVDPAELKNKYCSVCRNGEIIWGVCTSTALLYRDCKPVAVVDEQTNAKTYILKNLALKKFDGELHAICGRDITQICVFNDKFELENVFENKNKKQNN